MGREGVTLTQTELSLSFPKPIPNTVYCMTFNMHHVHRQDMETKQKCTTGGSNTDIMGYTMQMTAVC